MEVFEINCTPREEVGKKTSRKLRKEGNIPCVLYGGAEVIHFAAPEKSFRNVVYTPKIYLLKLDIGGKVHDAILKDIQFHPVTDKILHMDFIEVSDNKPASITIPLRLKGDSIGIKNGGKLRWKRRQIHVRGFPVDFPDFLDVDITDLDIGQTKKVGDLSFEKLQILDPLRAMVVAVVSSRLVAKGMAPEIEEVMEEVAPGETPEDTGAETPAESGRGAEGKQEE